LGAIVIITIRICRGYFIAATGKNHRSKNDEDYLSQISPSQSLIIPFTKAKLKEGSILFPFSDLREKSLTLNSNYNNVSIDSKPVFRH
jgi:hypothetical protein